MDLPTIKLSATEFSTFEQAIQKEWLITNANGGYASSTILGLNTRKYHGLLVAAIEPPGNRTVCLAKLDEDIISENNVYRLGANEFQDQIFPQGHLLLKEFSISPFPTYVYKVQGFEIQKTIFLPRNKNVSITLYECQNQNNNEALIRIYPMHTCRHFHTVIANGKQSLEFQEEYKNNMVKLIFADSKTSIITQSTEGKFISKPSWVEKLNYREEKARGETSTDDCYQPGYFEVIVSSKKKVEFAIATAANQNHTEGEKLVNSVRTTTNDFKQLLNNEIQQRKQLLETIHFLNNKVPQFEWLNWILLAADSFIVQERSGKKSIIAGYHWFESWGRDTFMALPGLMLVTGKFEDAKEVLSNFAAYTQKGLIPNIILDQSGKPLYNTVDGTLWYINAVFQYLKYTGDFQLIQESLWNTLKSIIENHVVGTDFEIKMDTDGLLSHGSRLTWMDACVQGEAVTPRAGKAVEVQALWYNALKIMEVLAKKFNELTRAQKYRIMAEKTKISFNDKFWNKQHNCIYDVVEGSTVDTSLRPNQVISASLDFPVIDSNKMQGVVDVVQQELLTPYGLRTLSRSDPRYRGSYIGNRNSRDQAYHNGTVWPWLLGPFTTAYLRAKGTNRETCDYAFNSFLKRLFTQEISQSGLGTISEIFEGDPPHAHRGCISQAWSVAEPLRAYVEEILHVRPKFERQVLAF